MATPQAVPMKHAASQQGRTPAQSHGAVATPPVSTPFSAAHAAAFSPHGPRSSPQQVKKSPATAGSANTAAHPPGPPMNFDSPSVAAAFGAIHMADLNLDHVNVAALVGNLGKNTEDERLKRLDEVIAILSQKKGVVSEAGLERLVKRLGLECIWEDAIGEEFKRTIIVAGSALELLITLQYNIVQSVQLSFPESGDIVNNYAPQAGQILLNDLKLAPGQSPLTKRLDAFARNFERLAILDKLSVNPGFNLYQAMAGVYVSLERLHQYELQRVREDPALIGKSDDFFKRLVMCTKSGTPTMNAEDCIGLSLNYWMERRLIRGTPTGQIWKLLIGAAPLGGLATNPVRISDHWISASIEKPPLPDDLRPGPILDWQEPETTFIPADPSKAAGADGLHADPSLLAPQLPEVVFTATFDPPVHVPIDVFGQIRHLGCEPPVIDMMQMKTYDVLLFPAKPGTFLDPREPRAITREQKVPFMPRGGGATSTKTHYNGLYMYKLTYGMTVSEVTFSHPQQLVSILPYIRQFAFLNTLLENSFGEKLSPYEESLEKERASANNTTAATIRDEFGVFMGSSNGSSNNTSSNGNPPDCRVDVTITVSPVPKLQIIFPFQDRSATVVLEVRENGQIHVESQNVLDETNSVAPDGRQRRPEDLGKCLEGFEHIGHWADFIRSRWA